MKVVSAGFIISEPRGWVLGRATNSGGRWDVPKGKVEPGESALDGAIRELHEETGLAITPSFARQSIDFGEHSYNRGKNLHLFMIRLSSPIDVLQLQCTSMVTEFNGIPIKHPFPELDQFGVFAPSTVLTLVGRSLRDYINSHVPKALLKDPK